MRRTAMIRALRRDTRGASAIEFALLAPVLLSIIMGSLEVSHTLYVQSVLDGEMQKAGRDMALEIANTDQARALIEARVRKNVKVLWSPATITFTSHAYRNYKNVSAKEDFIDANGNNHCDPGELYYDSNNNGSWDLNSELASVYGAKDVVVLTATVTYSRLAFGKLIYTDPEQHLTASTMLRNQPFDAQGEAPQRTCS